MRKEKFLENLEKFCLFDDTFMRKCFENSPACVELVLRIVMNSPDLHVVEMNHQYELMNLQGHSMEMDVFAKDEKGRKYNIEVQRRNFGAKPKRARYYSSLIDASYIIYVNGKCQDDTPLEKLMHDFACTKAEDMHYQVLAERVRCFKETEKGIAIGHLENSKNIAMLMLREGSIAIDKIA